MSRPNAYGMPRQLEGGAEVEDAEPASSSSRKLPGCGSVCSRPHRPGPLTGTAGRAAAASSRCACVPVRRDPGQRRAVEPALHQHPRGGLHDVRHDDLRVVVEYAAANRCWLRRLVSVVELLGEPVAQLGDERRHREAARDERRGAGGDREGPDVGEDRLADARVLDLDRDVRRRSHARPPGGPGRSRPPPTGCSSNSSKRSRHCGPSSRCSTASVSLHGIPGLDSCSDVSASRQLCSGSAGKSASTVDSSCPALSAPPLRSPRTRRVRATVRCRCRRVTSARSCPRPRRIRPSTPSAAAPSGNDTSRRVLTTATGSRIAGRGHGRPGTTRQCRTSTPRYEPPTPSVASTWRTPVRSPLNRMIASIDPPTAVRPA